MKPEALVFDVDGVIANYLHRAHHITRRPKSWEAFFAAMGDDDVIAEPVNVLRQAYAEGTIIILMTGRPARYRAMTEAWLARHNIPFHILIMRPNKVRRRGAKMKRDFYRRFIASRYDVLAAFDDHPAIVRMWAEEGVVAIPCGHYLKFDDPNNENPQG